jgi:hypothetical protein
MITEAAEKRIEEFVIETCSRYTIDESHGLKHSTACMKWAIMLIQAESDITDEESTMAIYAAGLHDMCDKKYTDPIEASGRIHSWLVDSEGWQRDSASALIAIINTMSYSWLKSRTVDGVPCYPDHGKWQRAYHITRHADLLDGYIVARCFLYGKHANPSISDEECWKKVQILFENRVFLYVSDGWIFLPEAVSLASALDAISRRDLESRTLTY